MNESSTQKKFALALAVLLIAASAFTYAYFEEGYTHEMPEEDCTTVFDYPMCDRAEVVQPAPPPEPTHVYLGMLLMVVLAISGIYLGWRASVTQQADLVTMFAKDGGSNNQQSQQQSQTVQQVQPPQQNIQQNPASSGKDAWGHAVPPAIPDNIMPPDAIVKNPPPQPLPQQPQQQSQTVQQVQPPPQQQQPQMQQQVSQGVQQVQNAQPVNQQPVNQQSANPQPQQQTQPPQQQPQNTNQVQPPQAKPQQGVNPENIGGGQ